eukprot:c27679_g1_i1.p2 GENE.c27679_g1_i1~~c27679_g1_i1.p2  ORF type:complete len:124 (+),score=20.26 c27679_g1_i1:363-734(+)
MFKLPLDDSTKMHLQPVIDNIAGNSCLRLQLEKLGRYDGPVDNTIHHGVGHGYSTFDPRMLAQHQCAGFIPVSSHIARHFTINAQAATEMYVTNHSGSRADQAVDAITGLLRFLSEHAVLRGL